MLINWGRLGGKKNIDDKKHMLPFNPRSNVDFKIGVVTM